MEDHGLDTTPPNFSFKTVARYADALRRQVCESLCIIKEGTLNRKYEFDKNVICTLRVPDADEFSDQILKKEVASRAL